MDKSAINYDNKLAVTHSDIQSSQATSASSSTSRPCARNHPLTLMPQSYRGFLWIESKESCCEAEDISAHGKRASGLSSISQTTGMSSSLRTPEVRANGPPSEVLFQCPENRPLKFATVRYRFSEPPEFLVCSWCYSTYIEGSVFAGSFLRFQQTAWTTIRVPILGAQNDEASLGLRRFRLKI
jgi:hypothetical protein